ncbi:MAG: hypothetical protein KA159_01440 [Halioglobus sp.]|nr:hypothetical protein [Halioglobus sp.]MBP6724457.1 hypothetical protein [Halioglobus sp.]
MSNLWNCGWSAPSYDVWWQCQSARPAYEHYLRCVQLIGSTAPLIGRSVEPGAFNTQHSVDAAVARAPNEIGAPIPLRGLPPVGRITGGVME